MTKKKRSYSYRLDDSLIIGARRTRRRRIGRYLALVLVLAVGVAAYTYFHSTKSWPVDPKILASHLPLARKLMDVRFLKNNQEVVLKPNEQLVIRPTDSIRLVKIDTDGWVSWGVKAVSSEFNVDAIRKEAVVARDIWPEESFETPRKVQIQFVRWNLPIGSVFLLLRLDAHDWLQKALAAQSTDEKIKYIEKALQQNPKNTLIKTRLANLYMEKKKYDEAARLYEEVAQSGYSRAILERLLVVYKKQDRVDRVLSTYLELLKLSSDPADFKNFLTYLQNHRSEKQAARFLTQHLNQIPKEFMNSVLLLIANLQARTNRWADAARNYERAIAAGAEDPNIYYNLAVLYTKNGKIDRAIQTMQQYLKKKPNDLKGWLELGSLQEKKGDLAQAQATYLRIVQRKPKQKEALIKLIAVAEKRNDKKTELSAYEKLARLQPDNKTTQFNLGVLYYDSRQWNKAARAFKKVASLDPKDLISRKYLLDIYRKTKNKEGELATLKALAQLDPKNPDYYDAIFAFYNEKKDYKRMVSYFEKAAQSHRNSVKLHNYLLYGYLKTGNIQGALKELEQLIRLQPEEKSHLRRAANLYEKSGQYSEALQKLEMLLKLDPNDKEAKDDYMRLRMRIW